ncbi:MAG: AI-2E family transporter [Veillonella sp.]|uniref:AI-2E family transporter n=1 Tax=Veillonella sp. TaxID=1926307 RepID=UPI0025F7F99D|nr:AI-2E family transporter [Veillonella sp.]MBS4913528.1 AI-2E family transporter [Veillonella sp.]
MNPLKEYKHIVTLIILAGIVFLIAIRFDSLLVILRTGVNAVMPLVWGVLIAFILNIIVKRFEQIYAPKSTNKWVVESRRPVCIILAILAVLLAIIIVGWMAIPQLVHSLSIIVQAIPGLYNDSMKYINNFISNTPALTSSGVMNTIAPENYADNLRKFGADSGRYIVQTMSDTVEMVFNFVIGLIFAIYVLLDKEKLRSQLGRLFRAYGREYRVGQLSHIWRTASQVFSSFFIGQFLDALILGVMVGAGLAVFSVPYALTIGCVIGLTALVPLLGAYIGGAMGLIMLLSVSPMDALIFIIVLVVMQQLEGNFIYPKIVGSSVGLPGIWVFAAITIGGTLYGVPGILLSVPIVATVYKLVREDVDERLQHKAQHDEYVEQRKKERQKAESKIEVQQVEVKIVETPAADSDKK